MNILAARKYPSQRNGPLSLEQAETRRLAYSIKTTASPSADFDTAAREMAALITGPCWLVPIPDSTGNTDANTRLASHRSPCHCPGAQVAKAIYRTQPDAVPMRPPQAGAWPHPARPTPPCPHPQGLDAPPNLFRGQRHDQRPHVGSRPPRSRLRRWPRVRRCRDPPHPNASHPPLNSPARGFAAAQAPPWTRWGLAPPQALRQREMPLDSSSARAGLYADAPFPLGKESVLLVGEGMYKFPVAMVLFGEASARVTEAARLNPCGFSRAIRQALDSVPCHPPAPRHCLLPATELPSHQIQIL